MAAGNKAASANIRRINICNNCGDKNGRRDSIEYDQFDYNSEHNVIPHIKHTLFD